MQLTVLHDIESLDIDPFVPDQVTSKFLSMTREGRWTWAALNELTGGLSSPSKMPCHSWSISARLCQTGGVLRKVKGSVCSKCYAMKGRYVFPAVESAMQRRLECLQRDPVSWAAAMCMSIEKTGNRYFRWHDSGDLLGVNHLALIRQIARTLPCVSFWLPTREGRYFRSVSRYAWDFDKPAHPPNLHVRISSPMVGGLVSYGDWGTSTVGSGVGFKCLAPRQGGKCLRCRECWSSTENIDYKLH